MSIHIPHITDRDIREHVTYRHAMTALKDAVLGDVDPATDFPRQILELDDRKQLLFMPSQSSKWMGTKLISVNPLNYRRGLDRVQGVYLRMDVDTTTPRAIIDGSELTELRTAAMSMVIADAILPRDARTVMLFGYGAQARAHLLALKELRPSLKEVVVTGRNQVKAEMFAANAAEHGWDARIGAARSPESTIPQADVILTVTGAGEPLFDTSRVKPGTLVMAIGSHDPDRRELEPELLGRSHVIVEDRNTALREAGDVAMAIAEGTLSDDDLIELHDFVRNPEMVTRDRPIVYKSVGMSWQDLAVAAEIYQRVPQGRR